MTVNDRLKDVQSINVRLCTHLNHTFKDHQDEVKKKYEEIAGAVCLNMCNQKEDTPHNATRR